MNFRRRPDRASVRRFLGDLEGEGRKEIVRLRRAMRQARIQIEAGFPEVASETLRRGLDGDRL